MFAPDNKANATLPVAGDVSKTAASSGIQAAEAAIAAKSEKAKAAVEKAQQAMQAAQMVQGAAGALRSAPTGMKLPQGINGPLQGSAPSGMGLPEGINGSLHGSDLPAMEDTNAAMQAANIFGILHVTTLTIVIDGNVYKHFESFQLQQSTAAHHSFRLVLQHDILGSIEEHSMEDARKFLGSRISVTFRYKSVLGESPEREFIGVITQVGFAQSHGNRGSIVLTGQSPTALLAAAPHTQSFGGAQPISLKSIADKVIKQGLGESRFDLNVDPTYTGNLPYSSQYNESHHNYLARMAAAYGEWYFYDGRVLHFGKPPTANPIKLIFGKDTEAVQLHMRAIHVSREHYGYNSSNHTPLSAGPTDVSGLGELGSFAADTSKKTFKAPSLIVSPARAVTDKDVEATQKSAAGAAAANAFTLTGKTTVPFLYPGCLIEMNFRKPESSDVKYFSKLIVTEVSHSLDALGNYQGHYEAIPADVEYLPAPVYSMPAAQPQMATVVSNANRKGRIKVQFDWQRGGDTTDFIRVATPDAGSSNAVGVNRGFVFIPEVDDQVMVNFVHGHPDRPFVQSALFHGGNGRGGFDTNHLKTIKTRTGNTIELDDTDGKGSITVKDASGNTLYMDGKGNITITASTNDITVNAPETMTFNAKNLIMNVQENMLMNVGNDKSERIGHNSTDIINNKLHIRSNEMLTEILDSLKTIVMEKMEEYALIREMHIAGTTDIISTGLITIKSGKGVDYSE